MKASIVVAALALGVAAIPAVGAQAGKVIEIRQTVGSTEPSPESAAAARHEAAAALAQARHDCREEANRADRQSCLDAARADYRHLMEMARTAS
nr:hypothetical protein [Caldimonas sp.]